MALFLKNRGDKISHITERLFHTEIGCVLISALFGVALAFMFQTVCKGDKCIIIKSPPQENITNNIYQNDGICYKYKIKVIDCNSD